MSKPSWRERRRAFLNDLRSRSNVRGVEKQGRSSNLVSVQTESGQKTAYLHYSKWFKEPDAKLSYMYFQGSWNVTESADRPLFHVFLGPSDDSVRVVPNEDLMSGRFALNHEHDDGRKWRLGVNEDANARVLDEYDDLSLITE